MRILHYEFKPAPVKPWRVADNDDYAVMFFETEKEAADYVVDHNRTQVTPVGWYYGYPSISAQIGTVARYIDLHAYDHPVLGEPMGREKRRAERRLTATNKAKEIIEYVNRGRMG